MKIKNTTEHNYGKMMNLPIAGETQIPSDGIIEVSDEVGELLTTKAPGWIKVEDEVEETVVEVEQSPEQLKCIETINGSSLEELLSIAEQADLPQKSYNASKKNLEKMKNFMLKNVDVIVAAIDFSEGGE